VLILIRNCPHGNEVATYYLEENQEKKIIKASTCQSGISRIKNEVEGWNWYQSKRYPDSETSRCNIIISNGRYIKISIQYIEGCKNEYKKGLRKNSPLIIKIIEQYCHIWQGYREGKYPMHGDLSIDNAIVNKDGVHIIDWEHYYLGTAPFGFDAYFLLFEQLLFSMKGRKKPNKSELDVLLHGIRLIRTASREYHLLHDKPLHSIQEFIKKNWIIWGNQKINKLPVLLYGNEQVYAIDNAIRISL